MSHVLTIDRFKRIAFLELQNLLYVGKQYSEWANQSVFEEIRCVMSEILVTLSPKLSKSENEQI